MTTPKIDLLAMAQQIRETYEEIECSFGPLRVYHVPDALTWGLVPENPAPSLPIVTMKIATGTQKRYAKEGDEAYIDYQKALAEYEEEASELRSAARVVYALKDIEYPDIASPPPGSEMKFDHVYPKNEILRKKAWLDFSVLAKGGDLDLIFQTIARMIGRAEPSEDGVDEIKKNSE
jgi:hypothetical protein